VLDFIITVVVLMEPHTGTGWPVLQTDLAPVVLSPTLPPLCSPLLTLPLTQSSLTGSQESSFLVQEAVKLWLALVRNLPFRNPAGES
jgi:hypothetical protein